MRNPRPDDELAALDGVLVTRLDVTDTASIDSAMRAGIEKFGRIDVVVNNAGYGVSGIFESASRESIQRQFAVNVHGVLDVTQKFLPHFRENGAGMFINISSVGGRVTFPLLPLYHATKFAIEGFSESLAYELAGIGVKIKIVEPGAVDTDFGGRSMDMQFTPGVNKAYDAMAAGMQAAFANPEGRRAAAKPEEAAATIYTAATDGADTLRYVIGADAERLLAARAKMSDAEFKEMMLQYLGMA